jgi:NifU-like protein involved in Fe-S cluster formation
VSDALYNTEILRLASDIPHLGELPDAQARARRVSPICGSRVDVALSLDDAGRVADFAQTVRACALGQASAAILGAGVIGRTPDELAEARDELAAYLAGADVPPPQRFPKAAVFAPARAHRARHASIRLAFEAAAQAASDALAHQPAQAEAP